MDRKLKKGDKIVCHTICPIQDFRDGNSTTTVGKIYTIIDIEIEKYNDNIIEKLKIIDDYDYVHYFYTHTYHRFFTGLKEMRKNKIEQLNKKKK